MHTSIRPFTGRAACCALFALSFAAHADAPVPQNVLQLSATGSVDVQQDLLRIGLATSREGADAQAVQAQLKSAVESALAEARKTAAPGQMDVRTGNFSLYPRYSAGSKMAGWTGNAEVVLEGRDFARITQAAGRIQTMTMGGVSFGLSREQRARVEAEAQAQAIEGFKAKASELAKGFGFSGWGLREVAVNASSDFGPVRPMRAAMASSEKTDAPIPVEAGKTTVTVTVSGSVQLK